LFDARAAIDAVHTGAIDASFRAVTLPASQLPSGVATARVLDEPVEVLTGPAHALAGAAALTPAQLAGHPIWMPALDPGTEWTAFYRELAAAFGLSLDVTGPDFGTEPLLDVIAGSAELATLVGEQTHLVWPDGFGLRRIPLRDPVPVYPHSLIWRTDNAHPALRALRDHLTATRRDRAAGVWVPEWARSLKIMMTLRPGTRHSGSRRQQPRHQARPWPAGRVEPRRQTTGSDVRPGPQTQRTALDGPPLVLAQAAPDPGVLAGLDGPVQARFHYRTTMTNALGFVDLKYRGTGVPDREEQFRVDVLAGGVMAPVHEVTPSCKPATQGTAEPHVPAYQSL
jgi:LysR substrate binding domain